MIEILIVASIALVAGLALSISSIIFATPKDEKVEALMEVLPGVNCGACGYSGCVAYAKALSKKEAKNGLCPPGGEELVVFIAGILGEKTTIMEKKVAVIKCQGHTANAKQKMQYQGYQSCLGANLLYSGDRACGFGCLGKGDCVKTCPENAIVLVDNIAVIKANLCTGCSICVKSCPKEIIEVLPEKFNQHVRCKNSDKGLHTRKVCKVGCIGCMKCQKICESAAIIIKNFVAIIDYEKCTNCGGCIKACPVNAII